MIHLRAHFKAKLISFYLHGICSLLFMMREFAIVHQNWCLQRWLIYMPLIGLCVSKLNRNRCDWLLFSALQIATCKNKSDAVCAYLHVMTLFILTFNFNRDIISLIFPHYLEFVGHFSHNPCKCPTHNIYFYEAVTERLLEYVL